MNKIKFSVFETVQVIVIVISGLVGIVSDLFLFVPKFQERIGDKLFPVIGNISSVGWGVILAITIIFLVVFNISTLIYQKKNEISNLPYIKLAGCGVEDILLNINRYGANSFIAKNLHHKRELLYIDMINVPLKKDKDKSGAIKVSVLLEYYDGDDGSSLYKKYLGRWMEMPERELGKNHTYMDISSNGIPERLGIAYFDYGNNTLYLLDSEQTDLSSEGIMVNPPHLEEGKYVVVATVLGSNLWDIPSLVFEISNAKDGQLKIKAMKDGEKWIRKSKKAKFTLWA